MAMVLVQQLLPLRNPKAVAGEADEKRQRWQDLVAEKPEGAKPQLGASQTSYI